MTEFDTRLIKSPNNRNDRTVRNVDIDQDEPDYKMDRHKRTAVIFNHFKFDAGTHVSGFTLKDRHGTNNDVARLKEVLEELYFEVDVHEDLKCHEIQNTIQNCNKKKDFSDQDCLAIFVLTHGIGLKLAARDFLYDPEDLWRFFTGANCPTLLGKPKLIFINACQGAEGDTGVHVSYNETQDGPSTSDASSFYKIPGMADILLVFSTVGGYVSIRNEEKGSWFIQSLCDNLSDDEIRKMELKQILTITSRHVASKVTVSKKKEKDGITQVPTTVSTLIRNLYLSGTNTA